MEQLIHLRDVRDIRRSAHRAVNVPGDIVNGPVTDRLLSAYSELVGTNIVAQYLAHLRPAVGVSAS